jgi:hypothetical protein
MVARNTSTCFALILNLRSKRRFRKHPLEALLHLSESLGGGSRLRARRLSVRTAGASFRFASVLPKAVFL